MTTTTATRIPPWRRDWKYEPSERHAVAAFARYCMGFPLARIPNTRSSHTCAVLRDDEVYQFYRRQMGHATATGRRRLSQCTTTNGKAKEAA